MASPLRVMLTCLIILWLLIIDYSSQVYITITLYVTLHVLVQPNVLYRGWGDQILNVDVIKSPKIVIEKLLLAIGSRSSQVVQEY